MPFLRRHFVMALVLALAAALPYAIAGSGSFVNFDDNRYVYANPVVREGLSAAAIRWAFTTFEMGNWHPLTWLSHLLDVTVFGLDARWHHVVSILIHATNTALLFLALTRLTGAVKPSALAAALFGVHPLHVESVAWVAERKDLLSAFFFLLLLLAYVAYARRGGSGRYLSVALALALGLMSKPMLVTAPFVLLLLDWWPLGRWRPGPVLVGGAPARQPLGRLLSEKVPLLLLCAASGVVTFLAQQSAGAVSSLRTLSLATRLGNALVAYAAYLGQTFWPSGLAVYYPLPSGGMDSLKIAGVSALLCGIFALAWVQRNRRPYLALGWCWFFGMLVPVSGVIQVGNQARADRYTYLPLIGIFLAAAWLVREIGRPRSPWPPLVTAAALLTCMGLSTVQAGYWRDSRTLFGRALAVTSSNPLAHNNFGEALKEAGSLSEAAAQFRAALTILPDFPEAHCNLGLTLGIQGRPGEALGHYQEALRLRPEFAEAHIGLGIVLTHYRRLEEAERHLLEASRLQPGSFEARANLGNVLAAQGRFDEARRSYREALRLRPESVAVRRLLETLASKPGKP